MKYEGWCLFYDNASVMGKFYEYKLMVEYYRVQMQRFLNLNEILKIYIF